MNNEYVQTVASTIIEQLKQGTAPWIKPWDSSKRFLPYNPISDKPYKGINSLWLMSKSYENNYSDPRWLTYKQSQALGAQVRKGEKGSLIQYWIWEGYEPLLDKNGRSIVDKEGKPEKIKVAYSKPRIMGSVVFNAEQIEGLPLAKTTMLSEKEKYQQAEAFLQAGNPDIKFKNDDKCYYLPVSDQIVLVPTQKFLSHNAYYATALHEKAHWSGHQSRLNRDIAHPFGSEKYAKEELRAEIASLMLGDKLEIGHDPGQHVAYIQSWIKILENDPREIFRAAADAGKIVDYLQSLENIKEISLEKDNTLSVIRIDNEEANVMSYSYSNKEKTYLSVPFSEKDEAKENGAKWDPVEKCWFAPKEANINLLSKWLPKNREIRITYDSEPLVEFERFLKSADLIIESAVQMDGKIHRVRVDGDKPGERSGAYAGYLDGHPAGWVQNYKTGLKDKWVIASSKKMTPEEQVKLDHEIKQQREMRRFEQENIYRETAVIAEQLVYSSVPLNEEHAYLVKKGIQGLVKVNRDEQNNLVIPLRDVNNKIWSTQIINPEGNKVFQKNGKVKGNYYLLEADKSVEHVGCEISNKSIVVCEGFATGVSLNHSLGCAVAVAFGASNLLPVASAIKEKFPEATLYIAGDNDHKNEKKGRENVGKDKAMEAASILKVKVILPTFRANQDGSDWNDIFNSPDKGKMIAQIRACLEADKPLEKAKVLFKKLTEKVKAQTR